MFKTQELKTTDAAMSYALVSCRYPGLSLPRWTEFVRTPALRGACARLTGLVDAKGRIHALFGYEVERAADADPVLHITHIATFRLAGNAIYRAFDSAVEQIARDSGCREVTIVPWGGVDPDDGPVIAPEDIAPGRRVLSMEPAVEPHGHPH
jgi:hypothetical protein